MSGPIIRKYGFPNFDKIFGEREIKHGEPAEPEPPKLAETPTTPVEPPSNPGPKKA